MSASEETDQKSITTRVAEKVRDYSLSFATGAVPAFFGTALMGVGYALGNGIGTAIGLSSKLSIATGIIGAFISGSASVAVGFIASAASAFGFDKLTKKHPFLNNVKMSKPFVAAGVVSGFGLTYMLAQNLSAPDEPKHVPQPEKSAAVRIEPQRQPEPLGSLFAVAGRGEKQTTIVLPPSLETKTVSQPQLLAA